MPELLFFVPLIIHLKTIHVRESCTIVYSSKGLETQLSFLPKKLEQPGMRCNVVAMLFGTKSIERRKALSDFELVLPHLFRVLNSSYCLFRCILLLRLKGQHLEIGIYLCIFVYNSISVVTMVNIVSSDNWRLDNRRGDFKDDLMTVI